VVNLKLLTSSSSFILWLRILGFKLKRGCSAIENKRTNLTTVKSLTMHCFINYFDYILHTIASNLRYFYIFFRLGIVLIKRRKRVVEARVLHAWAKDSPKTTKIKILSGLGFHELEKS